MEVKEARLRFINSFREPSRTERLKEFTKMLKAAQPKFWSKFRGNVASTDLDKEIKDICARAPFSAEEYHKAVEQTGGRCPNCGGSAKFDAPPRCPKCKSTELEYDATPFLMYD
jgi:predicted Zn-ribbon and HTH transcriptional regulator